MKGLWPFDTHWINWRFQDYKEHVLQFIWPHVKDLILNFRLASYCSTANCSHVCTQSSEKVNPNTIKHHYFSITASSGTIRAGCAWLASDTKACAKAAGSFDACQKTGRKKCGFVFFPPHPNQICHHKQVYNLRFFYVYNPNYNPNFIKLYLC